MIQSELISAIPFEKNSVTVGDSLDLMKALPCNCIDAIVTDPPFAITGGSASGRTSQSSDQFFSHWFADVVREFIRILKPESCGFLWCDWRSEAAMVQAFRSASERYDPWYVAQVIYHDREMIGMGSPFRNQVDRILFFRGRNFKNRYISRAQPNIVRAYWYYGKHIWHDAEKSPEVTARLIKWCSSEGDLILDPFCGSGTTALVARGLGRQWMAFEKDENIAQVARERLEAERWEENQDEQAAFFAETRDN